MKITSPARGRIGGDGVELAFGYWPGRGDAVVGIHGLSASHVNFVAVAERLRGRRPLFAVDLRGRGESDKPDGPYGMAQHARDVAAAMRELELPASVVIGHSMGAFVALSLAIEFPELVRRLVLVDGGVLPDAHHGDSLDAVLPTIARLQKTFPDREAYRAFWRSAGTFPEWNRWIDAYIDYDLGPDLRPKPAERAIRADFADLAAGVDARPVRVPVTLARAEQGVLPGSPPLLTENNVARLRERLPHLEVTTIRDTTHFTIALGDPGASALAELLW
jgi:pimeloyl-ACP methyl ester carboxylesterase